MARIVDKYGQPINVSPVKRIPLKNKQKEVKELSAAQKAEQAALKQQAIKLFTDMQSGSATMGSVVSGFVGLSESVKPRGEKKDPTPSKMGASVPGITTTSTPSDKASIDTLTGKTSESNVVVDAIVADGSPKGVQNALKIALNQKDADIKTAIEQSNVAAQDPVIQEQFRKLGMPEDTMEQVTSDLGANITKFVNEDQGAETVAPVAEVSKVQMSSLGNPFGSFKATVPSVKLGINVGDALAPGSIKESNLLKDAQKNIPGISKVSEANPFGSKGVDFGNILGAVAAATVGVNPMKDLGIEIPSSTLGVDGLDPETGLKVPNLVEKTGFTNLSSSVEQGPLMTAKATTPVSEIGASNKSSGMFVYNQVHSKEELTIDMKSIRRTISNINITWTGSAPDRYFSSGEAYNNNILQLKLIHGDNQYQTTHRIYEKASWAHYFIRKNGTIDRVLKLEEFGNFDHSNSSVYRDTARPILANGINITLDAGHSVPVAEARAVVTLSPASITAQQWKSLDSILGTFAVVYPGAQTIGFDEVLARPQLGPGFNVPDYMKKFGSDIEKITPAQFNLGAEQKGTEAQDNIDKAEDIQYVSYNASWGKYTAKNPLYSKSLQFPREDGAKATSVDLDDAIAFSYDKLSRNAFTSKYSIDVLTGVATVDAIVPNQRPYDDDPRVIR